jgi:hypothetical protein
MSALIDTIRHESPGSGLAFRRDIYGESDRDELIMDLLSLANAEVSGPRHIVLGVREPARGQRDLRGVRASDFAMMKQCLRDWIATSIEPAFSVSTQTFKLGDRIIGVIIVGDCDDPPYLLSKDAPHGLTPGAGWVRRGTQRLPLLRRDLERMFAAGDSRSAAAIAPSVGFPGQPPRAAIDLPALPLDELPSELAAGKLRHLLEAKADAKAAFGRTETHMQRLIHARVFGMDQAYEERGLDTIRAQLDSAASDYRSADDYYRYHVRAHPLQLVVTNEADQPIDGTTLQIRIPRLEGIGVADRAYAPTDIETPPPGYPVVKDTERGTIIQARIGPIPAGASVDAFGVPPRLCVRPEAAGNSVAIDYVLVGGGLGEPVRDSLMLRFVAAE